MRPLPPPRLMMVWRDTSGRSTASVSQGVRPAPSGGLVAVYIVEIPGERQERKTFACASRAISQWATKNGLRLTPGPA
jgi:hypothetical protein